MSPLALLLLFGGFLSGGCNGPAPAPLALLPDPPREWISSCRTAYERIDEGPDRGPQRVGQRPWKYIILHHSATMSGNAEIFDRRHRDRGFDELGYHFVIGNGRGSRDGLVEEGSCWHRQKWGAHTGGTPGNEYNNYGIGICLVGDFTRQLPSPKQLASLRRLVRNLMSEYDMPPENLIGHCEAPNASTECPGDRFDAYLRTTFRPPWQKLSGWL